MRLRAEGPDAVPRMGRGHGRNHRVVFSGYSQGGAIGDAYSRVSEWRQAGLVTVAHEWRQCRAGRLRRCLVAHRLTTGDRAVGGRARDPGRHRDDGGPARGEFPHDYRYSCHDFDRYRATATRSMRQGASKTARFRRRGLPDQRSRAEGGFCEFTGQRHPVRMIGSRRDRAGATVQRARPTRGRSQMTINTSSGRPSTTARGSPTKSSPR